MVRDLSAIRQPAQHPASAARAALNDCPQSVVRGAHLADLVSCKPLLDSSVIWGATPTAGLSLLALSLRGEISTELEARVCNIAHFLGTA